MRKKIREESYDSPELCIITSASVSERAQHLHYCIQRQLHLNKACIYSMYYSLRYSHLYSTPLNNISYSLFYALKVAT